MPASPAATPLAPHQRIDLHDLVVHREPGRPPLLGCRASRRFLEVDEASLAAVDALRTTPTLGEAAARLEADLGEPADLAAFAETLRERGFVRAVDGVPLGRPADHRLARWINAIPPEKLGWVRHPALVVAGAVLAAAWLAVLAARPEMAPRYADLYLASRPAFVLLATFGGLFALAVLHELGHFLVARSYGVDAGLRASRRLWMVVLETDVTNAWTLPVRQRAAVFLAGMAVNVALASAVGLLAAAGSTEALPMSGRTIATLRFVVLLNLLALGFQLMVFARTDLYYLLMALSGERSPARDGLRYVAFRARRLARRVARTQAPPCGACGRAAVHADDPFCVRCGARGPQGPPGALPVDRRLQRRLAAFGALMLGGQLAAYALFARALLGGAFTGALERGLGLAREGWAERAPGLAVDGLATILAASLPLAVIAYGSLRATRTVGRIVMQTLRDRRGLRSGA